MLWQGFNPWPRNFCILWAWPQKKKITSNIGILCFLICCQGVKKFYKIFQRNSLRLCCFSVILFVAYSLISAFKSVICFFLLSIYLVGYLTARVQVLFFLIYKVKAVNFLPKMALSLVRAGASLSLPPSLSLSSHGFRQMPYAFICRFLSIVWLEIFANFY